MTRFFENMTQQPRKFIDSSYASTTNEMDVSWKFDNSGGFRLVEDVNMGKYNVDIFTFQQRAFNGINNCFHYM